MISKDEFINYTVNKQLHRLYDKRIFLHHKDELQEYIDEFYPGKSIKEVAYILYYDIKENPKCKTCGKDLKFHDFIHGYRNYCDKSCAARDNNPDQVISDQIVNKEKVISVFIDHDGKYIEQRLLTSYLKKNGWWNPLMNYYDDSESCFETIYRIVNDINKRPVCKQCGRRLEFKHGFQTFCSRRCSNHNNDVITKISNGVSNKLTSVYKTDGDRIRDRRRQTLLQEYGINGCTPFDSSYFRKKAHDTIFEKYGVENILNLQENKDKSIEANRQRSIQIRKDQGYNIEYVNVNGETKILLKNGCNIHGDIIIDPELFNNRTKEERRGYTIICPYCNPKRNSETSIETQIKNILNDLNIQYEQHDRKCIKPYELDFYIPDYKVAIECNGIYWHSGDTNGKKLMKKKELCNDAGIRLLYFWEDEIHNKTEIIKSYLKSLFGKNEKIFARKCNIKEISSKESKEFVEKNHLQGNINASIKLGLFYNDKLVEVMTFGKLRKCLGTNNIEKNIYELYRLCSLGGYTIVGGASKLLKYFIETYKPSKIITYCSNDISYGNVYEKIGFKFVQNCGQGYYYINRHTNERKSRFSLRKDIVDDGSGRTEVEINKSNGWEKCYDSGNKKYEIIL